MQEKKESSTFYQYTMNHDQISKNDLCPLCLSPFHHDCRMMHITAFIDSEYRINPKKYAAKIGKTRSNDFITRKEIYWLSITPCRFVKQLDNLDGLKNQNLSGMNTQNVF